MIKTILKTKKCEDLKAAERYLDKLYSQYGGTVRCIAWPLFSESGVYTFKIISGAINNV